MTAEGPCRFPSAHQAAGHGWPRVSLAFFLLLVLAVGGCLRPAIPPQRPAELSVAHRHPDIPAIVGQVRWEGTPGRALNATMAEIAKGSTVSLLELDTGHAVASTLTAPSGSFSLSLAGWAPVSSRPYVLEAAKGLSLGGAGNRVGTPVARLRTVVCLVGGTWTSLTGPAILIGRSTTAVAIVAGADNLDLDQIRELLGSVQSGTADTFTPTAQVTASEYDAVWTLVNAALALDQDPVRTVAPSRPGGPFVRLERAPVVTDVSAFEGQPGDVITLSGTHFDLTAANNAVTFGGIPAARVDVEAGGTRLRATVPEDASEGPIQVVVGANTVEVPGVFRSSGEGWRIETIAGSTFPPPGTRALDHPLPWVYGVAVDASGRVLVANSRANQVIRVEADGTISLVAGVGVGFGFGNRGDGGPAILARLSNPVDVAVDGNGNVFVADVYNYRIRKIDASGVISTVAGNGGYGFSGDGGPATSAALGYCYGIAVDGAGNLFLTDQNTHRVRKVNSAGIITTVAGKGSAGFSGDGGAGPAASLNYPSGLAVDSGGNLYIADQSNHRVRKVTPAGVISTVVGNGLQGFAGDGGAATAARLNYPQGVSVDAGGNLLIADMLSSRIRKVTPGGIISTVAGSAYGYAGDGGAATSARMGYPRRVAVDSAGNLYISDNQNHRIRKVTAAGVISTFAGNGLDNFAGDGGPATAARLGVPNNVTTDPSGNIYFSDYSFCRIHKIDRTGTIRTVAGSQVCGFTGDGGPATSARIQSPMGLQVDAAGNVVFADYANHRIRKIDTSGVITTIAGVGTQGFSGDGGSAIGAQFNYPWGLVLDGAGNILVADSFNHRIRKISPQGIVTTVAGSSYSGFAGDGGPATNAGLWIPAGLSLDETGNLFIADARNARIRKVGPDGIITTVAGNGITGYSGDGGPATGAKLNSPLGVQVTESGDLLIADADNHRLRKVGPTGIISTVAGDGTEGFSGDGGPARAAKLSRPSGITVDGEGFLLVADSFNGRIRRLSR